MSTIKYQHFDRHNERIRGSEKLHSKHAAVVLPELVGIALPR